MPPLKRPALLLLCLCLGCLLAATNRRPKARAASDYQTYVPRLRVAPRSGNQLPNPSFEGGWYHPGGLTELQIPAQWQFRYAEGPNPLDPDPWNAWVRPEVRVLPASFLPPAERPLFIWDGQQTVKVFKGYGAISFELFTEVALMPGTYALEIHVFPDLVVDYVNGEKVWAPDPLSGEVRLWAGSGSSGWRLPVFGQKNMLRYTFTVSQPQTVAVGVAMRGRWAIRNNGWFMDDWWLYRIGG